MAIAETVAAEWLALELCKKLDIDPDNTGRIVVDLKPGEPAMVYIGVLAQEDTLDLPWDDDKAQYEVLKVKD